MVELSFEELFLKFDCKECGKMLDYNGNGFCCVNCKIIYVDTNEN